MWYTAYMNHTRAKRKDVYFMCNNSNKLENLLSNSKIGEMLAETKLSELIKKKEDPLEEKKHSLMFFLAVRSEERRVGKECQARCSWRGGGGG